MNPWITLTIAGVLEIGWAVGLKYADGFTKPVPSAGAPAADKLVPSDADAAALKRAMTELADASTRGWERFTKEIAQPKGP